VFYRHDEQTRMRFGLGMVNIRAVASWRRPRAAPRPVRGAGKWVGWPGSVWTASAEEGASRPLHASGVERYSWETRRPSAFVGGAALRVSETTGVGRAEFHNEGRGSIAWMVHVGIRGCCRTMR